VLRVAIEVGGPSAPQQREGERDVRAGRDVQRVDLEYRAGCLPLEETRPRIAVRVDAADAPLGRWHVEHHDLRRVAVEYGGQIAAVDGDGPALDELADLLFVGHGGVLSSMLSTGGTRGAAEIHRRRAK
jgi:hypothetical protein